jgi:hypothetical protein
MTQLQLIKALPRAIYAWDPGLHTGLAMCDQLGKVELAELDILSVYGSAHHLTDALYRPMHVCESFIINQATIRKTQAPWSLELIGLLRYVADRSGVDFVLQPPSAKKFCNDKRLRALGLWDRSDHARDAARHLVAYLVGNQYLRIDE